MTSKFSAVHQRCFEIGTKKSQQKTASPKGSTRFTYKKEPQQKNASPKHSTVMRYKKSKRPTANTKSTEGFVATRPLLPKTWKENATTKSKMPRTPKAAHPRPKVYFKRGAASELPSDRHSRFAIQVCNLMLTRYKHRTH